MEKQCSCAGWNGRLSELTRRFNTDSLPRCLSCAVISLRSIIAQAIQRSSLPVKRDVSFQKMAPNMADGNQLKIIATELAKCKTLVEDYSGRIDSACIEYYETGKTLFPSLSRAENEQISEKCSNLINLIKDNDHKGYIELESIQYPIDQYNEQIERARDYWIRWRNALRALDAQIDKELRLSTKNVGEESNEISIGEPPTLNVIKRGHAKFITFVATIISIPAGVVAIMSFFNDQDINVKITNIAPKEQAKTGEHLSTNISISESISTKDKSIVHKDASFTDVEDVVKGVASIVFDVKRSSLSLDTKYSDIDRPGAEDMMGMRIVDLLLRLEKIYNCKIEDGVAEKLVTIRDTVMLFLSCTKS